MIVPDLIKAVEAGQEKARLEIQGKHRMNERIQELAEHANYLATEKEFPYDADWFYLYNKKFAELIVAECCIALHPMLRDMISRTQGVDMIVNHFKGEE
jgi:hypothetical protein